MEEAEYSLFGPHPPTTAMVEPKKVDPMTQIPADNRIMATSVNLTSSAAVAAIAAGVAGGAAGVNGQQNLASLFECPVCFDYALPPIMQCLSGHIVCGPCRTKLASCPSCRGQLGNVRNLAMDRLAEDVMFPCKYSSNSCPRTMHYREKIEHEDQCDYRPYQCPCPGAVCKWCGALDEVMHHLSKDHRNITTLNGEDIVFLATDINLPGAVDWVMMQSCFGCHFMLVLEKQDRNDGHQNFYAIVQLIGNRKQVYMPFQCLIFTFIFLIVFFYSLGDQFQI